MSDKSVREAIALAYAKSVNPYSTRGNNFDQEQADRALAIISNAGYAVLPKEYEAKAKAFDDIMSRAYRLDDKPHQLWFGLAARAKESVSDSEQSAEIQRLCLLLGGSDLGGCILDELAKHSPKTEDGER